jgi:hypothetical protein
MSEAPVCSSCGERHWKVFRCDGTHVRSTVEVEEPVVDAPPVEWGASMEGFREFGESFESYNSLGGSTLVRRDG